MTLTDHFDEYFEAVPAFTETARAEVFRLRHAVYCKELGYEDPAAFPDGLERDGYDDDAVYMLVRHRASGRSAACVRLIHNHRTPALRFPFEGPCAGRLDKRLLDLDTLDRRHCGEISRLAVHADFRRRVGEADTRVGGDRHTSAGPPRRYPLLPMGLFLGASALGLNLGLEQAFVMMEPRLARLLSSCGIRFTKVGDVVSHRGLRGPFRIRRDELNDNLSAEPQALLAALRERLPTRLA